MTVSVKVPELGESITEAIIAEWLVNVGDYVKQDDILVELETDKITVAVPAPVSGILTSQSANAEDTVNVGDVIAELDSEAPAPSVEAAPAVVASPTATAASTSKPLSPSVARIVEENKLDPSQIAATGPGGRLLKGDVLAAKVPSAATKSSSVVVSGPEPTERVKMSRLRQTIAKRLVEAQSTAAILTTFNEVDMTGIMEMRKRYKEQFFKTHGSKLGFMSFFVKAIIEGLKAYPAVNAEIDGTDIIYKNYYHIGVAVGGARGLVVPVVRHADQLSFSGVEMEIRRLAGLAQNNRLALSDLTGGTFTVSNGGIYGSMLSTPILNSPQSGILGMHNIIEKPVVVDGEIVIRPMMYLALSYDHRIIDGKEAVSFLVRVKESLENPERILLEI